MAFCRPFLLRYHVSSILRQHTNKFRHLLCPTEISIKQQPTLYRAFSTMTSGSDYTEGMNQTIATLRHDATAIFKTAIKSVEPKQMIHQTLSVKDEQLHVNGSIYALRKNVYVVGFGKAVLGMISAVEEVLGDHIVKGIASVPKGIQHTLQEHGKGDLLLKPGSPVRVMEGARNNLPDDDACAAAKEILHLAKRLNEDDILIVCISGGGSALLPCPAEPVTLEDLLAVTKLLASHGADIVQLNTVRKNVELLKGGKLAQAAFPAKVISLILSDVIGDPLEMIASGPTVPDSTTAEQCLALFDHFEVRDKVPSSVLELLKKQHVEGESKKVHELGFTSVAPSITYSHVLNLVVGSNNIAIDGAMEEAKKRNYYSCIWSTSQEGEARKLGVIFAQIANFACYLLKDLEMRRQFNPTLVDKELELISLGVSKEHVNAIASHVTQAFNEKKTLCVISGGEPVVNVKGQGHGGRNTELALSAAIELDRTISGNQMKSEFGILILSGGTDGQDGPTDAAGALSHQFTVQQALKQGLDPLTALEDNDSYTFFKTLNRGEHLLMTGLTGTNVMDVQLLVVQPMQKSKY